MKYIIAIIQPDRLDEVIKALEEEEIILLTVSDVMGRGRQKGTAEVYRSHVEKNRARYGGVSAHSHRRDGSVGHSLDCAPEGRLRVRQFLRSPACAAL
jgi:2-phospho-L-lactate guanylyltransferase (CobY/MobA/RfbA family)